MFPLVLFGVVIYLMGRGVLERDEPVKGTSPSPSSNPGDIVSFPVPPIQPTMTADTPSVPAGWPSQYDYAKCEQLMAAMPIAQVKTMLKQVGTMSDTDWMVARQKMVSLGQSELANCLEGARQVIKKNPSMMGG